MSIGKKILIAGGAVFGAVVTIFGMLGYAQLHEQMKAEDDRFRSPGHGKGYQLPGYYSRMGS